MNHIVEFLELMASNVHHANLDQLVSSQPDPIKKAYTTNNSKLIKNQFSSPIFIANPTEVVQI